MICSLCRRAVLVTWALGDGRGVCVGCILRALKAASEPTVNVLERWRKLGLG